MKSAIIIFLITQTIASHESKPLDSLEVIEESTTPSSSFEVRESGTVPVEVVKDAVTETKSAENTEQVTENVRIERSTINEMHLSDVLEFNLGGDTRVADEEIFSDIDSITLADTSKAAEEVTTAAIDEETARRIDDESDIAPKEAEDSAEQLDTEVKTTAVYPEEVKAASEQSSVVDEEATVEKAGEEKSSLLEVDSEEDATRRLLGHKIIDTKARSGFEATADDVRHVQVTEDKDVSSEARSAIPLDSSRPFSPLPSVFTQPLVPLLRPNLLLKPFLTVAPSVITPPIQQEIFKPFPKMFQDHQQLQSQTIPPKQLYQTQQNHNSYPYSPTATTPRPVVQNIMDNLLSSSNIDQIFFKLSQASRAAQPFGYQYSNVVRTSSPVTSYQFSVPGFAQITA